jgi:hypothetical protein
MFEDIEDEEFIDDLHSKARERKVKRRSIDKIMRGNRSVFTIKETKRKRDKHTIEEYEG